ncbi:MAG: oligosaccharide flippase family protein [Methylobacter sp.]
MATIKQNIIANYLGQGWSGFMAVAFLPSYVHYLGVEAYGLIGLFAVIQALVMILDMGMGPTINREMSSFTNSDHSPQSIRDLLRSLEVICYSLATVIVIAAWLSSDYFAKKWLRADHLSTSDVAHALTLMTLVAALRLCESIYRGSLYGLEQQVWYNGIYSFFSTLRYVGALAILVWFSATIEAFFVWQAGVSLLTLVVLSARVYQSLPKALSRAKFSQESLIRVWKFAGGMMGISILTMLFLQMDKALLSRLVSLKDLGYYSLATAAANVMFMVVVPVTQAIYPQLVKLSFNDDQLKTAAIYHKTTQLVTVLTASASMLLCFFSGGVIFMWSGNQDLVRSAAPLLSILVIGSFFNSLSYLPYQLQVAHGWTSLLLKTYAFIVLLFIASILFIVPIYGVEGAAWVWVALNAVYLLLTSHVMHRRLLMDHKWKWYFFDILLPTCGAIIVMVLAKQLQPQSYDDRLHWFLFLLLTGVMAVLISAIFGTSIRGNLLRSLGSKVSDAKLL